MHPARREIWSFPKPAAILLFIWALLGDCPDFRGHRGAAMVGENGTVPFWPLSTCVLGQDLAKETPLPPQLHPWALFDPGAWKLVRVVTENFNEQGAVTQVSTSESKTTLLDVGDDGVTLEMKGSVEMAGKRFDTELQTIKQNFYGELQTPAMKLKEPTSGEVVIEDRKIPCQVQEIEAVSPNGKTLTKIFYSPSLSPYVLKRESVTTDSAGKNILNETRVSVQALEMPCKILGCLRSTAHVKTVQQTPKGTTITLAVICPEIPGSVISHTSKELDSAGRLVRRSTLELVDFSIEPEKDRFNIFTRKRASRYRTKSSM